MDDRVRIYELARKMNVPNQDIINTLRELGYDIKSHSSTVDKIGQDKVIAAFSKKKQQPEGAEKGKMAKTTPQPGKATTTKAAAPPPPQPAAVKPRVLSRYRPERPNADGTIPQPHFLPIGDAAGASAAHATQGGASTAQSTDRAPGGQSASTSQAVQSSQSSQGQPLPATIAPAQTVTATREETQPSSHAATEVALDPETRSGAGTEAKTEIAARTEAGTKASKNHGGAVQDSPPAAETVKELVEQSLSFEPESLTEPEEEEELPALQPRATGNEWSDSSKFAPRVIRKLDAQKAKQVVEPPKAKEPPAKAKEEVKPETKPKKKETKDEGEQQNRGPGVRPMSPSVPTRVAAPSMRATPPRPPKSHRPSPADRHAPKKEEKKVPVVAELPKAIVITTNITVQELAAKMGVPETEVIKRLFMKGIARTVNMMVEFELAKELAIEMEYEVLTAEESTGEEAPAEVVAELTEEEQAALVNRPPVVTIMGHVDHGKTSLLDAIRQTKFLLTDAEHGGITQHIGAYHVEVPDKEGHMRQIVFLDTPGHEAFTAMRARGAKVTDIAILVVAADDGVMPQTIEAIDHAKAAGVQIIVAVNKVDKHEADPDRVLNQLMTYDLVAEKFGGDTVTCMVSAKKRTGLDELLEMILLVSDILDLRANPDKPAVGVIIEAELSRGKGAVATALVENGTLREGDFIVAGSKCGRVRALFDDRGQRVKAAGPSMPVEVLGLDEVPQAGDRFEVVSDSQAMKVIAESRRSPEARSHHHVTLESLHEMIEAGEVKDLNVIVKADVQGTAEAIADQIRKLTSSEVQVRVLRTASGAISENDVNLAASSNAIVVGFNVQPDQNASSVADANGVDIRTYSIIYQITDDLTKAIQGLLKPIREEVNIGQAEVRQVFKVGKGTMIAGCMVLSGKVQRGAIARIERGGTQIWEGKLETLKRFKDDVKEVATGFECGMSFEKFTDLQMGDKVNFFIITETRRTDIPNN
ncbi:translation initiation factor IF-2 [bacterium]|nr:translation initiation factor IF-2 [bacterium]MBP9810132.1 translation initiation factor IF-2 [bacterium]